MNSYVIRRAVIADAETLRAVRADSVRNVAPYFYSERQIRAWIEEGSVPALREALASGSESIFVAEIGGHVAGYGSLAIRERPHLWALYVRPQYARKGVATELLKTIQSEVKSAGYRDLHTAASLCARGFYEARDFIALDSFEVRLPDPESAGVIDLAMIHMCKFV